MLDEFGLTGKSINVMYYDLRDFVLCRADVRKFACGL